MRGSQTALAPAGNAQTAQSVWELVCGFLKSCRYTHHMAQSPQVSVQGDWKHMSQQIVYTKAHSSWPVDKLMKVMRWTGLQGTCAVDTARRRVLLTARFHFYESLEKKRHRKQIGGCLSRGRGGDRLPKVTWGLFGRILPTLDRAKVLEISFTVFRISFVSLLGQPYNRMLYCHEEM